MLPDLLEVDEGILQSLADCGHATEGSSLQLLALEERLTVLQKTNVVARDGLDESFRSRELTKSNSEVIRIVEGVEQIAMERMDICQARESLDGGGETFGEGFGGVLDFTSVKGADSADLEACANLRALLESADSGEF